MSQKTLFSKKVYNALKKIPKGRVMTYGSLARLIGHPRAFRAVGTTLKNNPHPVTVPCHRVIRGNGEVGEYAFGTERKKELLKKEGVEFIDKTTVAEKCII